MYIKRKIEDKIRSSLSKFPVVLLTGPRQVGKTTVLNEISKENNQYGYVTLDDPMERDLARNDPGLFLQSHKSPLIIDEIQYATELLPYIKMIVDKEMMKDNEHSNGLYILTGSQMFKMMKNVSESLAGRVGILNLYGLSSNEINGYDEKPFIPVFEETSLKSSDIDIDSLFKRIFRGSMPRLYTNKDITEAEYYSSYVATYLERDIRDLLRIKDESKFLKFLSSIAVRTGQELIYEELSREIEIDIKTVQSWISILESSGLIFLLKPYSNNMLKRIIKRPKLYFMDTGLACYLARYIDYNTLLVSAFSGHIFETYVVTEIVKTYINAGINPDMHLYFYRDNNQKEIDIIIEQNNKVYPIEIKKSSNPGKDAIKNFAVLDKIGDRLGEGGVICMCQRLIPIDRKNKFIPIWMIGFN